MQVEQFTISNADQVIAAKDEAVTKALIVIGLEAEKHAKEEVTRKVYDTPPSPTYVRTGRLRNSIANEHDDTSVYVGTNVEYAPYVELGTSKMKARPFIGPAISEHISEYEEIFRRILKNS